MNSNICLVILCHYFIYLTDISQNAEAEGGKTNDNLTVSIVTKKVSISQVMLIKCSHLPNHQQR